MIINIMPNPRRPATTGPLVAVLAYDGLCTFEFGIASEVFGLSRPEMGKHWYRYSVCGIEDGPLRAAGGLLVKATAGLSVLRKADLIVVPGWRGIEEAVPVELIGELVRAHRRGARNHVALLRHRRTGGFRFAEPQARHNALALHVVD